MEKILSWKTVCCLLQVWGYKEEWINDDAMQVAIEGLLFHFFDNILLFKSF